MLPSLGYERHAANHSDEFAAPNDTRTQRIEALWRPVKGYFKGGRVSSYDFADYIVVYLWWRHCRLPPPFESLTTVLARF